MKLFAYRNKDDTVMTNVWEYAKAINDPKQQAEFKRNNVFYSLNRDPDKRKRMYAKRTPKGFYAFAFFPYEEDEYTQAIERKYGAAGESATHAFIKETFVSLDYITLTFEKKSVKLFGLNAVDEYRVDISGQTYYIDVCIEFERSEPEFYAKDWNNKVFIEVLYTHKNTAIKEQNLKSLGFGVFEYNASRLKFSENDLQNERFMDNIGRKYAYFFKEGTYLRKIHNPAEESERKMRQFEDKIKALENDVLRLKKENADLKSTLLINENTVLKQNQQIERLIEQVNADTEEFRKSKYFKKWLKKNRIKRK